MEFNTQFGNNVRRFRKLNHLTIQDLSNIIFSTFGEEISPGLISLWERGKRNVSVAHCEMLCKALGCTPNDLIPGYQSSDVDSFTERYVSLPDHSRKIVSFAARKWRGNLSALVEINGMYMSMPKHVRSSIALVIISTYEKSESAGILLEGSPEIDTNFARNEWVELLKE